MALIRLWMFTVAFGLLLSWLACPLYDHVPAWPDRISQALCVGGAIAWFSWPGNPLRGTWRR